MVSATTQRDHDRQRDRLVRSIAQSQLLTSAAMLLLAAFAVAFAYSSFGNPMFFGGLVLVFLATGLALLVPWTVATKQWAIVVPVLDIVAIAAIREGVPELGVGLFMVFPVIWMARNYRLLGAIASVVLASSLLWGSWWIGGRTLTPADFPDLILLPLTLAFISTTIFATTRRTTGQRVLLRSQATLTEAAFERARSEERLLEEILNAVEFGVIAFNADGEVTLVNDSHRRSLAHFGAARSAVMHPTAYQNDRVTPFPEESRPFPRAVRGQSFENLTLWVGDPGHERVAYSATSQSLSTSNGEPDGGVLVLRDVTAELDAIQARDDLVASVSHELRTPLTSILGYLELALDDQALSSETHHMIDIAHRNSERLHSLVTDLLLAASAAENSRPLSLEQCDIAEIVQQSVDDQRTVAAANGVLLSVAIADRVVATVDPLRLRQVIDNLVSNGIKYNRSPGSVTISATANAEAVVISVTDTGVGLSAVEQSQLFDKFYRTESARRSSIPGSGLGMGITREIVRQHGGDLLVHSQPGVGSTFTINLPMNRADSP